MKSAAPWRSGTRCLWLEQYHRGDMARRKLQAAGAHAVLDTLAELPALIADFDARLAAR